MGEDVLPPSAEESGSLLRGLGLAHPEGSGYQPGLSARVEGKYYETVPPHPDAPLKLKSRNAKETAQQRKLKAFGYE